MSVEWTRLIEKQPEKERIIFLVYKDPLQESGYNTGFYKYDGELMIPRELENYVFWIYAEGLLINIFLPNQPEYKKKEDFCCSYHKLIQIGSNIWGYFRDFHCSRS